MAMSGYVYRIKRGDTLPSLLLRMTDRDGAVLDLTDLTSAELRVGINGAQITRDLTILDPRTGGQVEYHFLPEDWADFPRGRWTAEVGLVYANGSTLTVPTSGGFLIEVEPAATS